jgi:hypothetical protein
VLEVSKEWQTPHLTTIASLAVGIAYWWGWTHLSMLRSLQLPAWARAKVINGGTSLARASRPAATSAARTLNQPADRRP